MATKPTITAVYQRLTYDSLPRGVFSGTRSGYGITFQAHGNEYKLTTKNGVRGRNIPVCVEVRDSGVEVRSRDT